MKSSAPPDLVQQSEPPELIGVQVVVNKVSSLESKLFCEVAAVAVDGMSNVANVINAYTNSTYHI